MTCGNMGSAAKRPVLNAGVCGGGHLLFGVVADLEVDVLHCAFELEEGGKKRRKHESQLQQVDMVSPINI